MTTLTQTLSSLSLTGEKIPQLLHTPASLSNEISNYPRAQLTPAIGVEFDKSVQLSDILGFENEKRNAVIKDLATTISLNGVAFFQAQDDLTPKDLATLGTLLGANSGSAQPKESTLHIHPTQELGENGLPIGKISSKADKNGRQISFEVEDGSRLASASWHTDISFEKYPASYTLLRMHTIPETGGDTLWASGYSLYDSLSPALAAFLSTLTATHSGYRFKEQSLKNGYSLRTLPRGHPENSGDDFLSIHPVIRTNATTGLKSLYVNKTFTTRINELSYDESEVLLNYLFTLQHQSHDVQVKYKWSKNNVAIWDNRCTTHLATFDYSEYRAGDRVVIVGEKPYYDPASKGRKRA